MTRPDTDGLRRLRQATGAPMLACSRALDAAGGDVEAALRTLRRTAVLADRRRAGVPGHIAAASDAHVAALVELSTETAEGAANAETAVVAAVAAASALDGDGSAESVLATDSGSGSVADRLLELEGYLGEPVQLRRVARVTVGSGVVACWTPPEPGRKGALGVVVAIESTAAPTALAPVADWLARHIAEAAPLWLKPSDIPVAVSNSKHWQVGADRGDAPDSGRGRIAADLDARIHAFRARTVLLDQPGVAARLAAAERDLGVPVRIAEFARFQAGEEIGGAVALALQSELEWSFGNAWADEVPAAIYPLADRLVLECAPNGPPLCNDRDAVDLTGLAWANGATMIVLPTTRLGPTFFPLSTRVAGPILQKFATVGLRVVLLGDLSAETAASEPLRAFIRETNGRDDIWILPDRDALLARIRL